MKIKEYYTVLMVEISELSTGVNAQNTQLAQHKRVVPIQYDSARLSVYASVSIGKT